MPSGAGEGSEILVWSRLCFDLSCSRLCLFSPGASGVGALVKRLPGGALTKTAPGGIGQGHAPPIANGGTIVTCWVPPSLGGEGTGIGTPGGCRPALLGGKSLGGAATAVGRPTGCTG